MKKKPQHQIDLKGAATRDMKSSVNIPVGCINAPALHALAEAIDRLEGFHKKRGGDLPDMPCLVEVIVENDRGIHARIHSGGRVYRLALVAGMWEFQ